MKIYKLKSNKDLFDRWTKLSKKTSKKITSMLIVQNDMEIPSDEIKEWYEGSLDEIRKVDEEFKSIVQELMKLREETAEFIKAQLMMQIDKKK